MIQCKNKTFNVCFHSTLKEKCWITIIIYYNNYDYYCYNNNNSLI